jgi:hypothetical protein
MNHLADWQAVLAAMVDIAPKSGDAADDSDILRSFLPTPAFIRALDPAILLVLGERGAGKTALFSVLAARDGLHALLKAADQRVLGVREVLTLGETARPPQVLMHRLLQNTSPARAQVFWLLDLLRGLSSREGAALPEDVRAVIEAGSWDRGLDMAEQQVDRLFAAVDTLDAQLRADGGELTVCYDQLDVLMPTLPGSVQPIAALFNLWFSQRRRWLRIRPKIFLRVDLFESVQAAFPDGSKFFAGHQTELSWDGMQVWRMWVKRLANRGEPSRQEAVRAWARRVSRTLDFQEKEGLGQVPSEVSSEPQLTMFDTFLGVERWEPGERALAPLMYDLVGRYMGASHRKGDAFRWVPEHVEDGHGRLLARSFLHVLQHAAEIARERPIGAGARPIRPADVVQGLERASVLRLKDVMDEDPWIEQVLPPLEGMEVPASEAEWCDLLAKVQWKPASDIHARATLPADTPPQQVLSLLERRGIIQKRSAGKYSVPEIYRAALKVKRRGGPKRRSEAALIRAEQE